MYDYFNKPASQCGDFPQFVMISLHIASTDLLQSPHTVRSQAMAMISQ